jgi:CheY-like chemotaxis protein
MNYRILLAEDDRFLAQMYKVKMQLEGFDTTCARDGEEALGLINSSEPFSLAVLDILMPKVNGLEVLYGIRHSPDPRIASMPVLFVSNISDNKHIRSSLVSGANEYLTKPGSTPSEIVQAVKQLLTLSI